MIRQLGILFAVIFLITLTLISGLLYRIWASVGSKIKALLSIFGLDCFYQKLKFVCSDMGAFPQVTNKKAQIALSIPKRFQTMKKFNDVIDLILRGGVKQFKADKQENILLKGCLLLL